MKGPAEVRQNLPFPDVPEECPKGEDGLPAWYIEVAVLAWPDTQDKVIPDLSDVLNLTEKYRDGELVWEVPDGECQVVRLVWSNNGQQLIAASPNSKGLPSGLKYIKYALT